MIEKLYDDNKELHTKVERLQGERGETMKKFDDNEKYWKAKYSKLEKENQQLFDLQKQLKDDNGDLLSQLDKFNKRIKMLENERLRDGDSQQSKDQTISELNK